MLNIYISSDLDGINGVVYPHQIIPGGESYFLAKKQLNVELNCMIEELLELDVNKITINDAHGSMENLNLHELNSKIEIVTGKPKPVSMLSGLDETYSCVFFTGYHAKAGSFEGVLSHTFSPIFNQVKLNGKVVGEIELNAIYAGLLGVPVVLISGDNIACQEALDLIDGISTVITKTAISTTSAKCRPNEKLLADLKDKVRQTIDKKMNWKTYKQAPPYTIEFDFVDRKMADIASLLPYIKRITATNVQYTSNDFVEVYKLMQFFAATLSK